LAGWVIFLIAATVYLSTIEPTASFWDCGEYISTAYKLEVGHPPGAPLFNLIGRFFTLFSDEHGAALMINAMNGICSAFTILFLFWTITAFAKKIALQSGELNPAKILTIMGSGIVGSLAYTFSDSFWFSAVEGEVYAMSSFFTAIVFWAILKWEEVADEPHSLRWIILIAFLMGLSIGVHLLNLLAIPAIVFVYYFKRYKITRNGFILTSIISVVTLGVVQAGIIPGIVSWAAKFELFFVNSLGMPFNSGTIFYFLLVVSASAWGLWYTTKKNKPALNTGILAITMLLIGYSSFFTLVIRSQANTPMDENNPENAINLLSYLNREQYGDWPILYGQYYNAPLDPAQPYKDGNPTYTKDEKAGKYVITQDKKNSIPNYDKRFCTIFPRMHSDQRNHVSGYRDWADIKGTPITTTDQNGEAKTLMKPTFGENLTFFFRYQLGHMYARYFMWNFVGRQNDIQGHGGVLKGNWLSGIAPIDAVRLGPQENLPSSMTSNKGYNRFYFLPLILGLVGLFFHFKKDKLDGFIVFLLFVLTGVAIIVYLNNTPYQPRERDYGYVGSFYAFAIWIGLGVFAIADVLSKKVSANIATIVAIIIGLFSAPVLMAKEGWDDHDRSDRYTARDFAANYLNSCAPNAILFTNGDNDTFPLWYAQEVEGIRTDVRVVNLSLSNTDWYIEQMRRKAYDSDPIPLTLKEEQYRQGTRDYVPVYYNPNIISDSTRYYNIKQLMEFVGSEDPQAKIQTQSGMELSYLPTDKVLIPVDSALVVGNGTVPKGMESMVLKAMPWKINKQYLMKNDLMIMDIISTNNWKRPIYFAVTVGDDAYMNLEPYFQLEGLAYRLVPMRMQTFDGQTGKANTDIMYENMMNKFKWGGMSNDGIYMDENNLRMTMNLRNNFARLAEALIAEGKNDKARKVIDRCMQEMPRKNIPYNYFMLPIAEVYYKLGMNKEADALLKDIADIYEEDLTYYFRFKGKLAESIDTERQQAMAVMQRLGQVARMNKQEKLANELDARFKKLTTSYPGM
ncbi:MAG: protein O-mannosyl-transferase family, partial [Bacteroidota bacterium]